MWWCYVAVLLMFLYITSSLAQNQSDGVYPPCMSGPEREPVTGWHIMHPVKG